MNRPRLTIIVPAFNEETSIGSVLESLVSRYGDFAEIIVVNDGSTDRTADIASTVKDVRVINHKRNYGYGAAIKTGISEASGDLVCLFDGDGQHDPDDILRLYQASDDADMVVGCRGKTAFHNLLRAPGRLVLYLMASFLVDTRIRDLNSGLRLLRHDVIMRYLHLLPNGFSASTTMTMVLMARLYEVKYIDIISRPRKGKSQVSQLRDGSATIMLILRMLLLFNPMRFFLPLSIFFILLGGTYGAYKIYIHGGIPGLSVGSLLIILIGLLSFLVGLLCDQISCLRIERFEDSESFRRFKENGS